MGGHSEAVLFGFRKTSSSALATDSQWFYVLSALYLLPPEIIWQCLWMLVIVTAEHKVFLDPEEKW